MKLAPVRIIIAAVLLASLASCGKSSFESAKDRFRFLQAHGATHAQLCGAAREAATDAAEEQRTSDYQLWNMTALNECESASLEG